MANKKPIVVYSGKPKELQAGDAIAQGDVEDLISDLSGKQETLVSGTNIKTINGDSILGSGDLVVTGGSGISEEMAIAYAVAL